MDRKQRTDAVYTVIDNAELLFPVFSTVLTAIHKIYSDLDDDAKDHVQQKLRELISDESYVFSLDINKAYAVRVLALQYSPESEGLLANMYNATTSPGVRRDIILTMAKWEQTYWLSDLLNRFRTVTSSERRAIIVASYRLTDEGQHWREHKRREFSPFEKAVKKWASKRVNQHKWDVPI